MKGLYGCSDPALRRLRGFTDRVAGRLRLVVYVRRQDDHLISRYQQVVKTGEVCRLHEWAQQDLARTYDYHSRLRTWAALLDPTELVVRRFEPESFAGGSLHQDFLDAAAIDVRVGDLREAPKRNESLDADSVEFLRLLNLYRVEQEAAVSGLIDNRPYNRRLAGASDGPVLTLPTSFLDEFMSRWAESNQQVARHFLGDSTGRLFRTPRKTANTTTEQRLDPARLDHFFELSELPEDLHAPLRRIAEREATIR